MESGISVLQAEDDADTLRVYLQTKFGVKIHKPLDWGGKKQDNKIVPVFTKKPPATDSLLTVVS